MPDANIETRDVLLPDAGATAKIRAKLTWGAREKIKKAIRDGVKVKFDRVSKDKFEPQLEGYDFDAQTEEALVALEQIVVSVREKDDTEHPFTRAWFEGLTAEDGDVLCAAVDGIRTSPKAETPAS
jgi:hypothetical protein